MRDSQIEPGTYRGRASSWQDDMVDKPEGAVPILRVRFHLEGGGDVEWTCWVDDMYNREGQPSANLKGLLACGVTMEDVQSWLSTGELRGLDRRDVDLVVEYNSRGYAFVRYVNGERELRPARPLDRGTKAKVAQKMLAALGKMQAEQQQGQGPPAQPRPPQQGRLPPPPRPPEPSSETGPCGYCGAARRPDGSLACDCPPF